jgi:hypothetical protein
MKKNHVIIALTLIIVALIFFKGCDNNIPVKNEFLKENKYFTSKIDSIKNEYSILSDLNDSLKVRYINGLNKENNTRELIRIKYRTIHDTISNDTIECLPKEYVNELISVQDSLNVITKEGFIVKDEMIELLKSTNNLKDSIILNDKSIIDCSQEEIKKHKRGKIKYFFTGIGVGLVGGIFIK